MIYAAKPTRRLNPAKPADSASVMDVSHIPTALALAGQLTSQFRAHLASYGLSDWEIYCLNNARLGDLDHHLSALGEDDALWEPHPDHLNGGEQPSGLSTTPGDDDKAVPFRRPAGFLWLRRFNVVISRWHLFQTNDSAWTTITFCAAPSPRHYAQLRTELLKLRRQRARNVWQVVTGESWRDERIPRGNETLNELILSSTVRQRIETEVGSFFSEPVARMYQDLGIPYRRGLLLYGPPGNGKTSIVRALGGLNTGIPGFLLRPGETFSDTDLKTVIDQWQEQAPAILVIEDLDWLFNSARLNLSTFLNMLDGVDRRDGGLLLIATSNHPDALDPAINNRPGRFDIAIEVASPDDGMRREFLNRSSIAAACTNGELEKLVLQTDGLSFAHLREIESQSGLLAVMEGRSIRGAKDIFTASGRIVLSHGNARDGFPEAAMPFGLQAIRSRRGA